mgnify:FL=1
MVRHLAIFDREAAAEIFSGKKKIEGRFSQIKIAPYGKVSAGDVVLIKISGEDVVGQFSVDRVIYFDPQTNSEVEEIKKKYGRSLALPVTFWLEREKIKFASLMFIKSATKFIVPPKLAKKDLRAWVVLQ